MDKTKIPKLNQAKLTPEQRDKLDLWQQGQDQTQALQDIADITQEVLNVLDKQQSDESIANLGALLVDIRESLSTLKDKEALTIPDYAKPVVDAVSKLEQGLSASIKAIDIKPNVVVDAPQVNVDAPSVNVDLKGVEKLLKTEVPKAFADAIQLIPQPEREDNQPLLDAWQGISEQLLSIETATRMKPLPGSMTISNLSEVTQGIADDNPKYAAFQFDPNDSAPTYIGKNINSLAGNDDSDWVIYKFTYSGSNVTSIIKKVGSWTNRATL